MYRLVKMYRYECGDQTYAALTDVLADCVRRATAGLTGLWTITRREVVAKCDVTGVKGRTTFSFIYRCNLMPSCMFFNTGSMISKAIDGEFDDDITHGESISTLQIEFGHLDDAVTTGLNIKLLPSAAMWNYYAGEDNRDGSGSNAELLDFIKVKDTKGGKL